MQFRVLDYNFEDRVEQALQDKASDDPYILAELARRYPNAKFILGGGREVGSVSIRAAAQLNVCIDGNAGWNDRFAYLAINSD